MRGGAGGATDDRGAVTAVPVFGRSPTLALALPFAGLAATSLRRRWLVDSAVVIARPWVERDCHRLDGVAIGTSLPELVACVIATSRGHLDVALGDVIGSNIDNLLGILGATAVIHPIAVPAEIASFDIWMMVGATVLLGVFLCTGWTLRRHQGGVFLALYAAFVGNLII